MKLVHLKPDKIGDHINTEDEQNQFKPPGIVDERSGGLHPVRTFDKGGHAQCKGEQNQQKSCRCHRKKKIKKTLHSINIRVLKYQGAKIDKKLRPVIVHRPLQKYFNR